MKIGILTLPLHTNYGGILQAYALQEYLNKQGHEVVLINRRWNKGVLSKFKTFLNFKKRSEEKLISSNTSNFINNYFNIMTKALYSESEMKKEAENQKFDLVVVGSDQVWRLDYIRDFYEDFFLNFLHDNKTKKISYAASFGENSWNEPDDITKKVTKSLNEFDLISVREDSAVKLCKDQFNTDAEHHVDPTMLLSSEDYVKLLDKKELEEKPDGDVLVYMLDITEDRKNAIKKVSHELNSKPFYINVKSSNPNDKIEDRICPKVTSWIKGFNDAKFVITDSFHGCVFSIIFNKPFIAYGNKRRGLTRFTSVLKMFGLENRLILQEKDLDSLLITEPINWKEVNNILNIQKSNSNQFFKKINF